MHRVIVIGGGFGGLNAALHLKHEPVEVTLIDRRNFHLFQPLLYQVATGALSPGDIAAPIRNVLKKQSNARVLLGDVTDVDAASREVVLSDGARLPYDSLIVATGSAHSYFGHDEWEKFAPGLKTVEDATAMRTRILFAFEAAERESDPERRKAWTTFVIVGGGPTGVELAGALGEIANDTLAHDFRVVNPRDANIILVEGADRVLGPFPESLAKSADHSLHKLGVDTRPGGMVTAIDGEGVTVKYKDGHEERIASKTVLWAAGVKASGLGKVLERRAGAKTDKAGRVFVEPDCSLPGHPEIFVIGDLQVYTHQTGKPLPGVAQPAIQGGEYVAKVIGKRLRGEQVKPFHYFDKGNLAVIGRLSAVADLHFIRLSGAIGWFVWAFVHIAYLIGFGNRLVVLTQWAISYMTFHRTARLITGQIPPLPADTKPLDEMPVRETAPV